MEEPAGPSSRDVIDIDVDNIEDEAVQTGSNDNADNNSERNTSDDLPPIGSGKIIANVSWAYSLNYYRKADDDTAICRLCEQEAKKKITKKIQTHFKTTNFGTSGNDYNFFFMLC